MFAHFWLRLGCMVLRPHLYCLPSRFTLVRSLYWVLGLCSIRPGYCCVGNGRRDDYDADSFASLTQCCSCGGFFPSFAIFALVWGLLFLGILAFIPRLHFWCCLFCSVCLFSSSLSPTVASLVCFKLQATISGGPCLCVLSSCWVWGRLLLSLFWCNCSAFFLGHLRFSAACHAAGYPSWVPHLADSDWLTYSCSGRLAWGWGCLGTDVLIPHLVFYLVPAQLPLKLLPLWGSAPLACVSACLTPVCWSTPGVRLEGSLLLHLAFSHVPCSSSGPAGSLGVFRSPGVCPSASLVTWVGLQPFPSFSVLLLLRLLAVVGGVMHPVLGWSSCGGVCLV